MSKQEANGDVSRWANERNITEWWAGWSESSKLDELAQRLPRVFGFFVFIAVYLARALNVVKLTRYRLTSRRIRVERGLKGELVRSVPLEEIDQIEIENEESFTRTGTVKLLGAGEVMLTMVGIRDPHSASETILEVARSVRGVRDVRYRQEHAEAAP